MLFGLDLIMVLSHEVAVNILLEYVDSGCRELARADPLLEEQVQLGK